MEENRVRCYNKCTTKKMKCVKVLAMLQKNRQGIRSICCKKCTQNAKIKIKMWSQH
jgi:hypothetical protein